MLNSQSFIKHNQQKVYLYMTILTVIIGLFGHLLSTSLNFGLTGTGIFLLIAGVINFLAFFFSDRLILAASQAKPLTQEAAPEYHQLVATLCQKAGLPLPKLYYLDTDAMNAFATGRSPRHAAVAVTKGLLEKLTPQEIQGVVAHELAHIQNYDMRLMAIVSILAGLISILSDIVWRSRLMDKATEKDTSGTLSLIGFFVTLFAPLTAMFVQLAISRKREFIADTQSAQIIGQPTFLATALQKISQDQTPLPHVNYATAHIFFTNPFRPEGFLDKIMSTHPPVSERIHQLQNLL